jgi:hypothetical protein
MIAYFLSDPVHLNEMAYYQIQNLDNHNLLILVFRESAIEIYDDLSESLELPIDSVLTRKNIHIDHCQGTYMREKDSQMFEIIKHDGIYVMRRKNKEGDTTLYNGHPIFSETRTQFTVSKKFCTFIYNDADSVTGLVASLGRYRAEFKKVK